MIALMPRGQGALVVLTRVDRKQLGATDDWRCLVASGLYSFLGILLRHDAFTLNITRPTRHGPPGLRAERSIWEASFRAGISVAAL